MIPLEASGIEQNVPFEVPWLTGTKGAVIDRLAGRNEGADRIASTLCPCRFVKPPWMTWNM